MMRVSPDFAEELRQYGDDTVLDCFNCGTCVALCPLQSESYPRRLIRYVQLGARDKILDNAGELWRCLHCGLCSHSCPRQADPGGVLLLLKRYVVASWRN